MRKADGLEEPKAERRRYDRVCIYAEHRVEAGYRFWADGRDIQHDPDDLPDAISFPGSPRLLRRAARQMERLAVDPPRLRTPGSDVTLPVEALAVRIRYYRRAARTMRRAARTNGNTGNTN